MGLALISCQRPGKVDCGERCVRGAAFYLLVLRCHGLSVICEVDVMTIET